MEKCGIFWKNGRFSGRIWPDWGNTARADMAGLGSIGLKRTGTSPRYTEVEPCCTVPECPKDGSRVSPPMPNIKEGYSYHANGRDVTPFCIPPYYLSHKVLNIIIIMLYRENLDLSTFFIQ